jgi:hypothetical protein
VLRVLPGVRAAGNTQQEPYTLAGEPREYCGLGNFTQSYSTLWGWANSNCENTFISICRIRRELAKPSPALHADLNSSAPRPHCGPPALAAPTSAPSPRCCSREQHDSP